MIRLNNTPQEGSTVKVNLGFRDSAGQYYIPTKVQYTLLALNNDKESWSVVDNLYEVALTPASSVTLTIPDVKTITGTTLSRKVMVYWDAFVDNQYSSFIDEITFDIAPKPYIPNPPAPQPQPTIYVEITDIQLQIGTLSTVPVNPVFLLKTNLPVNIMQAVCRVIDNEQNEIPCTISVSTSGANLTVEPNALLSYNKPYKLAIAGLKSTINEYEMRERYECNFVTQSENSPHIPLIQEIKEVSIVENGTSIIEPDEGYDGIKQTIVRTEVPENPILLFAYQGTSMFYFTKELTITGTYKMFVHSLESSLIDVTVEDDDISFEYNGNTEHVMRNNGMDIMK